MVLPVRVFTKDLHTTTETKNEMEGALLLDVVVAEGSTVFQLLAGEDQALLIGWNTLFVLNFRLHVLDGIAGLDFKGDGLAGKGLDEDLHATTETKHKMESAFFLDVVVAECATVF